MVNVIFNFLDSEGNEQYTRILVSPAISPTSESPYVITSDAVSAQEKGVGVTMSLYPNTYNVRATGLIATTEFLMTLPTDINGQTVNASDYIVSSPQTASYTASYALTANTASYALTSAPPYPDITDDGSTVTIDADLKLVHTLYNANVDGPAFRFAGDVNSDSWVCANDAAAGRFGIGTTTPQYNVDITAGGGGSGTTIGNSTAPLLIQAGVPFGAVYDVILQSNGGNVGIGIYYTSHSLDVSGSIGNSATKDYVIGAYNSNSYINANGGNVGIGTNNPQFTLDVNGYVGNNSTTGYLITNDATSTYFGINGGNVGIATNEPQYNLDVNGSIGNSSTGDWEINFGGSPSFFNANGGAVGIGFNNPIYYLDVNGGIAVRNGTGYDENTSDAGVHIGYTDSPRVLFCNGDSSQNWQIRGGGSQFQWFLPDNVLMVLNQTSTGMQLQLNNNQNPTIFLDTNSGAQSYFSSGSLGINKSSAAYTLDVAGTINFTGSLLQNGSAYAPASASHAVTSSYAVTSSLVQYGVITSTSNNTASYNTPVIFTTGTFTLALPAGVAGIPVTVKKLDSGTTLTISASVAGQKIDGASGYTLTTQYSHNVFTWSGSNWYIIG